MHHLAPLDAGRATLRACGCIISPHPYLSHPGLTSVWTRGLVRAAADDVDTYDICLLVPYDIRICCFEVHE